MFFRSGFVVELYDSLQIDVVVVSGYGFYGVGFMDKQNNMHSYSLPFISQVPASIAT